MTLPHYPSCREASQERGEKTKGLFNERREEIITLVGDYDTVEEPWQTTKEYLGKAKDQLKLLEDSEAKQALSPLSEYLLENLNTDTKK